MSRAASLLSQALRTLGSDTGRAHLLPAGSFETRDARAGTRAWTLTDAQGQALATKLSSHHKRVAFQIDYEHQVFKSAANGQPAPAAGWANSFEWKSGLGLFATDVQWTPRGKEALASGEYRYISPVLLHTKTGEIDTVFNAALVAVPALALNPATLAALSAVATLVDPTQQPSLSPPEPTPMTLAEQLRAALGCAADTPDATLLTSVASLQAAHARVTTELAALKAAPVSASAAPSTDPVTLAAMSAMNVEIAALKAQANARDVTELVSAAVAAGKLIPESRPLSQARPSPPSPKPEQPAQIDRLKSSSPAHVRHPRRHARPLRRAPARSAHRPGPVKLKPG